MDRIHAMNLAMIRKAAEMTQEEVAAKLGGRQGDISRIENRQDLLLSTLLHYLTATGAEDPRIVVTVRGQEIELDLGRIAHKSGETSPSSPDVAANCSPEPASRAVHDRRRPPAARAVGARSGHPARTATAGPATTSTSNRRHVGGDADRQGRRSVYVWPPNNAASYPARRSGPVEAK